MLRRHYLSRAGLAAGALTAMAGCLGSLQGGSGQYPSKNIDWVIPYSVGGGFDTNSRAIAKGMEDPLGVSIVPKNVTGSGGVLAYTQVYNSDADGYTIGSFNAPDVFLKQQYGQVEYKTDDFEWFGAGFFAPAVVLLSTSVQYNSPKELSNLSKPIKIAATSPRNVSVLAGELILNELNIPHQWVFGYQGIAEALGAVKVGEAEAEVEGCCNSISGGMINDGKLKILATCAEKPDPKLGGTTVADLGMDNLTGLGLYNLFGLPPGVDSSIQQTLTDAYHQSLESDPVKKWDSNSPLNTISLTKDEAKNRMETMIQNIQQHGDVFDKLTS